ncbi:hypothetical protein HELRODRAFT_182104 [Helobdella robusta]|uniref:Uncharacterized protein n=1 Tax=Helobdella robusta TaxID=6412 RepID=T1FHR5_HELRO|nr:hypothetical protein HELRODRAFT_182104 [Helobdella robusta]ESN91248.1 hypothetical protein HELRODRAFT_182104 [Helobdella robusta]
MEAKWVLSVLASICCEVDLLNDLSEPLILLNWSHMALPPRLLWVLRSALNFASDGEVVREVGKESQRKGPEKAKADLAKECLTRVASAREQDMEIYEKRKGHEQLDEQQS